MTDNSVAYTGEDLRKSSDIEVIKHLITLGPNQIDENDNLLTNQSSRRIGFRPTQKIMLQSQELPQKHPKIRHPQNHLLISRKTMKLLKESSIIQEQDFLWLLDFFQQYPNLKIKDIDKLPPEKKHFFDVTFNGLVQQASIEWKRLEEKDDIVDESEGISCQLCGKERIKYVCYIQNKFTEAELCVGRECVKDFGIDKNNPINDKQLKEQIKFKRKAFLEVLLPGIERIKNSWLAVIDNLPMSISAELEEQYLTLGEKIAFQYNNFIEDINSPRDQHYLKQLNELLAQQNELLKIIHAYTQTNHTKKFAATRAILLSLQRHSASSDLYRDIKDDQGFITERTIFRITESKFLQSLIPELNQYLKPIGINIIDIETSSMNALRYKLYMPHKDIYLYITTRNLLLHCGPLLFGQQSQQCLSLEKIIENVQIHDISKRTYAELLKRDLRLHPVDIYKLDEVKNQLIIALKIDNPKKYIALDFNEVFNRSKLFCLARLNQNVQLVLSFLTNPKLTKCDYDYILGLLHVPHGMGKKERKEYIEEMNVK